MTVGLQNFDITLWNIRISLSRDNSDNALKRRTVNCRSTRKLRLFRKLKTLNERYEHVYQIIYCYHRVYQII